jgi:hypothetical protein
VWIACVFVRACCSPPVPWASSRRAPIPELFFGCFFCHNVSAVTAAVALFKQQEDGAS